MNDSRTQADVPALVTGLAAGDRRAIARACTLLETMKPGATDLIAALSPRLGLARVTGFTGPPGAGKSTLVNAYIRHLRSEARKVAVIAVDPSSPVTGGSILGDRVRMTAAVEDETVFVRALASRGALGGLSPAAVRILDALDGAGFDDVLLETVGTGQSEIDVAEIADVRVVIAAPGLGDDIQAMKSGHLEIADVVVVNKGDLPGAEITRTQLMATLGMRAGGLNQVPILKTTATTGEGIAELADAIARAAAPRMSLGVAARRRRRARYLIARAAAELIAGRIRGEDTTELDHLADEVLQGKSAPLAAAARFLDRKPHGQS
jgi:LAO/AO transport system kinase